jgi:hypothetical protein
MPTRETVTKSVTLYDGEISIAFNNNARNRYCLQDGRSPVGVTTVLQTLNKPALMTWPMNEALKYLETKLPDSITLEDLEESRKAYTKKSDVGKSSGTDIHEALESVLLGRSIKLTSVTEKPLKAFKKWYRDESPRVIELEKIVYSKLYDYAGTADGLLEIDGETVLVDWKTTNASRTAPKGIYPEMFCQLGAYSLALHEENKRVGIQELMIVRIAKDGTLNTCRASELGLSVRDCEDAWLTVLKAYRFLKPLEIKLGER